uniref:Uncharacterized protein n=1 Tax=Ditylenchus dipsaci TaxID=166011 RepID=A0A915DWY5_9BILA
MCPPKDLNHAQVADLHFANVDVDALKDNVKEVLSLTESVVDGLEKLKKVGEKSAVLFKLLGPVGSVVATGLATVLKDDPEELEIVRQLQTDMTKRFDLLENQVSTLGTKIENTPALLGYDEKISLGVSRLEESYSATMNDQPREPFRSIYIESCRSVMISPFFMLDYIKRVVVDQCSPSTIHQTSLHVEAYAMLERIQKILGKAQKIGRSCSFTLQTKMALHKSGIYELLDQLETSIKDFDQVMEEESIRRVHSILRLLTNDIPGIERCLPNAVANLNMNKRSALDTLAGIVAYDVVRTIEMGGLCAALLFDEETRQKKLESMKYKVDLITSFLAEWIKKKLDSTWPDAIRTYAQQSVENDVTEVNNAAVYTPIAEKMRVIANERTYTDKKTATHDHQVLVMEAWTGPNYFYSFCGSAADKCIVVENFKMINFVICRHPIDLSSTFHKENAKRMNDWIARNQEGIKQMTQDKQSMMPLSDLLKTIRTFYDYRAFKAGTIVFVRKLFWLEPSTYINVGLATSHIAGLNETTVIETFCPHYLPDPVDHVRFKLFFFV